jgi:hypothetical protein
MEYNPIRVMRVLVTLAVALAKHLCDAKSGMPRRGLSSP